MSEQYTYTVYRHTSPSGKIYIGITKHLNVKIRWCNGSSYVGCPIFYKAILKYGWDNIKHEILFNNLTKERAEYLEKEFIRHYKALGISYNVTDGGEGGWGHKMSEENKQKLSRERKGIVPWKAINASLAANTGKKRGPRDRVIVEKIRQTRLKNGKKCTPEMIQANIERNLDKCHPVLQYDLNMNLIAEYRSIKYASEIMKCSRSGINECIQGKRKTCKGYIWKNKYNN